MTTIFDLRKIKEVVARTNPQALVIVDTNILMNNPDILAWHTSLSNPIYIISELVLAVLAEGNGKLLLPQGKVIDSPHCCL